MDSNKKNIIIAVVASVIMAGILYYKFSGKSAKEHDLESFRRVEENVQEQDKAAQYEKLRRQKLKELNDSREVGSIDDFLENQKDEQPFEEKTEKMEVDTSYEKLLTEQKEKPAPKPVQKKKTVYRPAQKPVTVKSEPEPEKEEEAVTRDRFYTAYDVEGKNLSVEGDSKRNFIKAVVYRDHQVGNGSPVRVRLLEDGMIEGKVVKKNTILTGTASLSDTRVHIQFNELLAGQEQKTVQIEAYSMDGVKGLAVPGGIKHELKEDAISEATDQISTTVNLPVVGGLTVRSGRKKLREAVINVPDGTYLLIK